MEILKRFSVAAALVLLVSACGEGSAAANCRYFERTIDSAAAGELSEQEFRDRIREVTFRDGSLLADAYEDLVAAINSGTTSDAADATNRLLDLCSEVYD